MRLVLAICISFVGLHTAWAQERSGEAAYSKVCRVCHGPQGRGDLGPALVPMTKDADEVLGIVREGLGEMPPVSTRELTDDQVAQIVEYLKSLSSPVPSERSEHRPNDVDVDVLWVLVKGSRSWQIVARHATRILP